MELFVCERTIPQNEYSHQMNYLINRIFELNESSNQMNHCIEGTIHGANQ